MAQLFNENAAQMAEQQARAQQNQMMQQMVSGISQGLAAQGLGVGTAALINSSSQSSAPSIVSQSAAPAAHC